jgi:hypothetical protein
MMRARLLKPGFFKNEELAHLDPYGRLLYAGLWLLADKVGRLEDRPARLRVELFPYDAIMDDVAVDALLSDLATAGFIQRYEDQGRHYIAIPTFLDHQKPHPRETPSRLPAPSASDVQQTIGRFTQGQPKVYPRHSVDTPRRSVSISISDPVPVPDPVSVPVSDPVSVSKTVSGADVENLWKSGIVDVAREAMRHIAPTSDHDEQVDTVQWVGRQKRLQITKTQAAEALAIVFAEVNTERGNG